MADKKTQERFYEFMRIILFIFCITLILAGIFCITEFYLNMSINNYWVEKYNWKYIVKSWAILLSIVSSFIFLVILLMLFFPKTRFAKSMKKTLSILIPNCLIKRFYPGRLDEIEPDIENLKKYFGTESLINQLDNTKKRWLIYAFKYFYKNKDKDEKEKEKEELNIKHGLLKARRHFFVSYFYVFLCWLILHCILLCKTHNEYIDNNREENLKPTKNEECLIITKEKAAIPVNCCGKMTDNSISITKYITLNTTEILSFQPEKYSWDKFSMDNIFGIPISFNDERNMIFLTLDTSKYTTSYNSTTKYLLIIDKTTKDMLLTIESKPCQDIHTVVFSDKKIKYHFYEHYSLIFKKPITKMRAIITSIKKNSENVTLSPELERGDSLTYPLPKKDTLYIQKTIDNDLHFEFKRQKDIKSFLINSLSMLSNVFLLILFGFLNAKTDIFEHEINDDNYLWLKLISIAGFVLVCFIDAIAIFIGVPSLNFAMETIIAIVSVIAVFGVWGSLKNSYTDFGWGFTLIVFIYAAAQILAVFLDNENATSKISISDTMTISMLFIVLIGKIFIIFKILHLVNTKKLSWFFLHKANEGRTDSYEKFVNLFDDENGTE